MYSQIRCVIAGGSPPRLGAGGSSMGEWPRVLMRGRQWTTASAQLRATRDLVSGGVTNPDHQSPLSPARFNRTGTSFSPFRNIELSQSKTVDTGTPSARLLSLKEKTSR